MKTLLFVVTIGGLMLGAFSMRPASAASTDFQITSPRANSVVPGEVVEVTGSGAEVGGTVQVEVLTDRWYLQTGTAQVNSANGSWTFSPVHLAGMGTYNNHTIRATIIKNGQRTKTHTISGVVRKQ